MKRPALDGVRVVDFSWVVAGPMATKMLGAMGAEVIKIESTLRPEFKNRGGYFAIVNNNKKSATVNISKPEGQALLRRLIGVSDVVVENFSSSVLRKYGLSYEHMREARADIIFCSASGVGRTGPQRDVLAYGTLLQGYSGRAGLVGEINADLEGMGIVPAWTDPATAMWEVVSILAALRHRQRTGEGTFIDLSMLESTVSLLPEAIIRAGLGLDAVAPGTAGDRGAAPSGCFRVRGDDAWLAVSVQNDAEWGALCAAMNRADLAADERYRTAAQRITAKDGLDRELGAWLASVPAEDAETRLRAAGIPAARSRSTGELLADPHLAERGLYPTLADGSRTIALPWRDEDGWRGDFAPPPDLGADNDYVFGDLLKLSRKEIDRLVAEDVIR